MYLKGRKHRFSLSQNQAVFLKRFLEISNTKTVLSKTMKPCILTASLPLRMTCKKMQKTNQALYQILCLQMKSQLTLNRFLKENFRLEIDNYENNLICLKMS